MIFQKVVKEVNDSELSAVLACLCLELLLGGVFAAYILVKMGM